MGISPALFSSDKDNWETPQDLFEALNREFHFTLDAAADNNNAKCPCYFNKGADGLKQEWSGVVWLNPPYGKEIVDWIVKAIQETLNGVTTVMLLPARTSNDWFHRYIYARYEIRFLRGRLKFVGAENVAPFPSMIVVFKGIERKRALGDKNN